MLDNIEFQDLIRKLNTDVEFKEIFTEDLNNLYRAHGIINITRDSEDCNEFSILDPNNINDRAFITKEQMDIVLEIIYPSINSENLPPEIANNFTNNDLNVNTTADTQFNNYEPINEAGFHPAEEFNEEEENVEDEASDLNDLEEHSNSDEINSNEPINFNLSKSLLYNDENTRFSGAQWFNYTKDLDISLAGLGGIGSYVAFLLSRLVLTKLHLYDNDTIESVNLSGQLFSHSDLGLPKTTTVGKMMDNYGNSISKILHSSYTEYSYAYKIMICGFDNMEARKIYFNNWYRNVHILPNDTEKKKCLFIDGRLNAEEFEIFCIQGTDLRNISTYKNKYLFSDEEAAPTVCSYKQTSFCASMIASMMVNLLINFVTNTYCTDLLIERDLPFYTYYNAATMFLNNKN